MTTTRLTLLERLHSRASRRRGGIAHLYTPLLYYWARRAGLQSQDAANLAQEVLVLLVRRLPEFAYNPASGGFRSWLRTVTLNRLRDRRRTASARSTASRGWKGWPCRMRPRYWPTRTTATTSPDGPWRS